MWVLGSLPTHIFIFITVTLNVLYDKTNMEVIVRRWNHNFRGMIAGQTYIPNFDCIIGLFL